MGGGSGDKVTCLPLMTELLRGAVGGGGVGGGGSGDKVTCLPLMTELLRGAVGGGRVGGGVW